MSKRQKTTNALVKKNNSLAKLYTEINDNSSSHRDSGLFSFLFCLNFEVYVTTTHFFVEFRILPKQECTV